jgi:hypothetical protein
MMVLHRINVAFRRADGVEGHAWLALPKGGRLGDPAVFLGIAIDTQTDVPVVVVPPSFDISVVDGWTIRGSSPRQEVISESARARIAARLGLTLSDAAQCLTQEGGCVACGEVAKMRFEIWASSSPCRPTPYLEAALCDRCCGLHQYLRAAVSDIT